MSIGTAIVITSGKGGTGKTSTAAGVAACLAAMGKRTLCIDADIGLRNLDLTLGMTDQALMDFTDVIQGRCSLEKAAAAHKGLQNLYLITAPVTLPAGVDEDGMRRLMRQVRETFDYCIIDCPAGVGTGFRLATCAADRAIVVCNADAAALRDDTEDIRSVPLGSAAVVIGSEGRGVSQPVLDACRATLKIPMRDRCESLNAAVAASVVLWEGWR